MLGRNDLHEYQRVAVEAIKERPAIGLFLDMGLGKTVTTLTAVQELMHQTFDVGRVLVIAPLRVAQSTWRQEALRWEHLQDLTFSLALGDRKKREAALVAGADVTVINRENVEWLVRHYGRQWPFDMVVIDELSSFRTMNKRFKALRAVRPYIDRVVGLTGTPTPKGLIDLWPQIYLLDGGKRLGKTQGEFQRRFFYAGRHKGHVVYEWLPRPGADKAIYNRLQDLCISMKADDWLEVPPGINIVRTVRLPQNAQCEYTQLERDCVIAFEDDTISAVNKGVLAGKLLQYANGAVYVDQDEGKVGVWRQTHDAKLDELDDLIESANGKPVLVYYTYTHDRERIQERHKDARVLRNAADVEAWNRGDIPILLAHPASAGHGLNLQRGGHIIIWFGMTWNLELYQQANARLLRQGQTETVRIYHIVAAGTRDEDCLPVLEGRALNQNLLMAALKARVGRTA